MIFFNYHNHDHFHNHNHIHNHHDHLDNSDNLSWPWLWSSWRSLLSQSYWLTWLSWWPPMFSLAMITIMIMLTIIMTIMIIMIIMIRTKDHLCFPWPCCKLFFHPPSYSSPVLHTCIVYMIIMIMINWILTILPGPSLRPLTHLQIMIKMANGTGQNLHS